MTVKEKIKQKSVKQKLNEGGLFIGPSHAEGGIKFKVESTGETVEVEGEGKGEPNQHKKGEFLVCNNAMNDQEEKTRRGKPAEILSEMNSEHGCNGLNEKAEKIKGGESVINRRTVSMDSEFECTGTDEGIASALNQLDGHGVNFSDKGKCRLVKKAVQDLAMVKDGVIKADGAGKMALGGKTKKLLAPNGNLSNLNAEQYKLVRTPSFKNWFGDWENNPNNSSKVVDENGEPKVVYNGSATKGLNAFITNKFTHREIPFWKGNRIEWLEFGAFFTDDLMTASLYSSTGYEDGEVRKFFLNIKNPILIDNVDKKDWADIIPKIFIDGYVKKENDGFIVKGIKEQEDYQTTYNVKSPEQIKLADGTNTTFNQNNTDIRYDTGGKTEINAVFKPVDCKHQIFAVIAENSNNLSRIFVRIGEHYDGDKFKDKIFTFNEFKNYWIDRRGKFDYYDWWFGFNVPDYSIKAFVTGKFNPLLLEEKWLIDNIKSKVDTSKPYYIVGYAKGNDHVRRHELAHALYYLSPKYKKAVNAVIDSIPKSELKTLTEFLDARHYHKSVYKDEMQAYLLADKKFLQEQNGWRDSYEKYRKKLNDIFDESDIPDGKQLDKMEDGGKTPENEDFSNSAKNRIFVPSKITKDELQSIISGTRKIANGDTIQAALTYIRREKGANPITGGTEPGIEEERLIKFIDRNNLWYAGELNPDDSLGEGGEHIIYEDPNDKDFVLKTNNLSNYQSWSDYLINLLLHNTFFQATSYELIGFKKNEHENVLPVVRQHFVPKAALAELKDVQRYLFNRGFQRVHPLVNAYRNWDLGIILGDLHNRNVLIKDDVLFFIDTKFFISTNVDYVFNNGGKTESLIGKTVSLNYPLDNFGKRGGEDNVVIDKETDKAVHLTKGQTPGVMRDTSVNRWVSKKWIKTTGSGNLLVTVPKWAAEDGGKMKNILFDKHSNQPQIKVLSHLNEDNRKKLIQHQFEIASDILRNKGKKSIMYTIEIMPVNKIVPSQFGDDYGNSSSEYEAKQYLRVTNDEINFENINESTPNYHQGGIRIFDFLPIAVDESMQIIDGNHRHYALVHSGNKEALIMLIKTHATAKDGGKMGNYNKESVRNIVKNEGFVYAVHYFLDGDDISVNEKSLRKNWIDVNNEIEIFWDLMIHDKNEELKKMADMEGLSHIIETKPNINDPIYSDSSDEVKKSMQKIQKLLSEIFIELGLEMKNGGKLEWETMPKLDTEVEADDMVFTPDGRKGRLVYTTSSSTGPRMGFVQFGRKDNKQYPVTELIVATGSSARLKAQHWISDKDIQKIENAGYEFIHGSVQDDDLKMQRLLYGIVGIRPTDMLVGSGVTIRKKMKDGGNVEDGIFKHLVIEWLSENGADVGMLNLVYKSESEIWIYGKEESKFLKTKGKYGVITESDFKKYKKVGAEDFINGIDLPKLQLDSNVKSINHRYNARIASRMDADKMKSYEILYQKKIAESEKYIYSYGGKTKKVNYSYLVSTNDDV